MALSLDALLSAPLVFSPRRVGDDVYVVADFGGRLSLWCLPATGEPRCLLPDDVALLSPALLEGAPFELWPEAGVALVMIDRDGDEELQPCRVPLAGGVPERVLGPAFDGWTTYLFHLDPAEGVAVLVGEHKEREGTHAFRVRLGAGQVEALRPDGESLAAYVAGERVVILEQRLVGDVVAWEWTAAAGLVLRHGVPFADRPTVDGASERHATGWKTVHPVEDRALLGIATLFDDLGGIVRLGADGTPVPVAIHGLRHGPGTPTAGGRGELERLVRAGPGRWIVEFNADAVSWAYLVREAGGQLHVERVLVGEGARADGVLQAISVDDGVALAVWSSATVAPTVWWLDLADPARDRVVFGGAVPGVAPGVLSGGEAAAFTAPDGLRIDARLYLPTPACGVPGPWPVVVYIHGGPQSQSRPDFTWFSMPLVHALNARGLAVLETNARGSTGYGADYTRRVDRDWGGLDRLDQLAALDSLAADPRVDAGRAGVVGRSYGGYMTLLLAARHPDRWRAAVDMFGPADLVGFLERVPAPWRSYVYASIGHPERDRDDLVARSPLTWLDGLACPLLVIQGAHDPRVTPRESREVVERALAAGKDATYVELADEGHDVVKLANRRRVYGEIAAFFADRL